MSESIDLSIDYDSTESPTLDAFHQDHSFLKAVMGPVGSGKSVACVMDTLFSAMAQEPSPGSKYRPFKSVAVRNSYRELQDTTIATYQAWIPPELGHYKSSEERFDAEIPLEDGTIVDFTQLYRALDTPKDARKLLSLEVSHAWFNEAREIPFGIIDLMQTRIGRYPAYDRHTGFGTTNPGIILDTNPPDEDSRFYEIFEELRPDGYRLFRQPGGREDSAENVVNLLPGYYDRLCQGKTDDWIKVYVDGLWGWVNEGKPIFPEYNDRVHCSDEVVPYIEGEPVYIGMDFGLTPAAVFLQLHGGTYYAIREIVTENLGAVNFIKAVSALLRGEFASSPIMGFGDPAGDQRSALNEAETVFTIIRDAGLPIDPAPTQDPVMRRESVAKLLQTLSIMGLPRLIVSPLCKYLRKGLRGAYCYKRLQVAGQDRYRDKPDKNIFSHICEALEYAMVGMGEGYNLIEAGSSGSNARVPKVIGNYG